MSKTLTLGSLFDGSGGFPLGGMMAGIQPLWASEIEPFPIRVTTKRLPDVTHLGDISNFKGDEIEPVDIITFGSPCQDMSIAGKRAGLDGARSNLFYEAIRIIKEMRRKTNGQKPRYIVWENVPGAFSSNKGADFEKVLHEICRLKEHTFNATRPEKWSNAGLILAEDFSLSWRVLDASYFGVPQKRRRIFLVADFNGQRAPKILFEQESLCGDFNTCRKTWQRTAGDVETGPSESSKQYCLNDQGGSRMDVYENKTGTITASVGNHPPLVFENHGQHMRDKSSSDTITTFGIGSNNQPIVYSTSKSSYHTEAKKEMANTLVASDYKDPPVVNMIDEDRRYAVRRLTPKECGRLQGFPDMWCEYLETENPIEEEIIFWTDVFETHRKLVTHATKPKSRKQIIKWLQNPYSDSAEYKMWGNGVALPCVFFIMERIKFYHQKC
ncbi:DNA (cytosine-5-)-methyltransferase [Veillonellaceae bacterium M2-4]|nr:DNA (cytosine-5-)-methyltransferase [Veillonellaceae bacterium M2-4]